MAVSTKWAPQVFVQAFKGEMGDLSAAGALEVLLFSNAFNTSAGFDATLRDAVMHADAAPFTSDELTGGNYARQTLTGVTIGYDAANDRPYIDAGDTTFANLTGTSRFAVVAKKTADTDAHKAVVAYVDFGQDEARTGADLVLQWNASGIVGVTVN